MKKRVIAALALGALMAAGGAQAAAYKEMAVTNGGLITGKVLYAGASVSANYPISKDTQVCGTGERSLHEVRAANGALLDAVVYLDKVTAGKPFPATEKKTTVNQKGCAFMPFVTTLANGGDLEAINSDPVLHNIHTYELIGRARKTVINVSQPDQGNVFSKKIQLRRGNIMKVECDAHDFMHGYVFVGSNPYYAQVGDDGAFHIGDVPPGEYVIKVWHGKLGTKASKVTVTSGGKSSVNLAF